MFAPHDRTSNLRSNSNPFRTGKCITSNPTKEQNKEILCSYDFPNQTSWPVRSCCTIPIWQMTLHFSWILGFTSVKEPFSLFSTFFSSFYCVDFFISFVLRHLWVKQFFALRMSWGLQIVRKNAFHQSRTERNDNRAAPEMSACKNSGANKNWSVVKLACTTGAL